MPFVSLIKDGVDYGAIASDFYQNEEDPYYSYIQCFGDSKTPLLRLHDANGVRISSAILVPPTKDSETYSVLEVKRPGDATFVKQTHDCILDWCLEASPYDENEEEDEDYDYTKYDHDMFDRIYIGPKKVPLWRVLQVAYEADEEDEEDEDNTVIPTKEYTDDCTDNIQVCLFLVPLLILFATCIYIWLLTKGLEAIHGPHMLALPYIVFLD